MEKRRKYSYMACHARNNVTSPSFWWRNEKILNGQDITIISNQIRPVSIKQQQELKESFVVVNKNPTSTKKTKFPSLVYLHSVFKLHWNLGDTPCPGNLALWLVAGPFAHRKRSRWLRTNLPLTARQLWRRWLFGCWCAVFRDIICQRGGPWLPCRWLCVYLWDHALKILNLRVERYCWLGEWF